MLVFSIKHVGTLTWNKFPLSICSAPNVLMFNKCLPYSFIHSFIHTGYFHSASSSPLLLRGAPDTARIPSQSFTPKRHRQLQVKDLSKDPTWRLERGSNPRPFKRKTTNLPMSHHAHKKRLLPVNGNNQSATATV